MYAKLMMGAVAVLAAALFAYLGHSIIAAYGVARYQAGLADGRLQQVPQILSANALAAKSGLDARDRIIAAETAHASEAARLAALIQQSQDEVKAYETSSAGAGDCLDAERVRAVEAARGALFPARASSEAASGSPGPVPTDTAPSAGRRNPGQR
jgi:hypothetical protein